MTPYCPGTAFSYELDAAGECCTECGAVQPNSTEFEVLGRVLEADAMGGEEGHAGRNYIRVENPNLESNDPFLNNEAAANYHKAKEVSLVPSSTPSRIQQGINSVSSCLSDSATRESALMYLFPCSRNWLRFRNSSRPKSKSSSEQSSPPSTHPNSTPAQRSYSTTRSDSEISSGEIERTLWRTPASTSSLVRITGLSRSTRSP